MNSLDSIKRRLNGFLPRHHRWLLVALAAVLIIITQENDYESMTLVLRHADHPTPLETPSIQPPEAPAASDTLEQASRQLLSSVAELPPDMALSKPLTERAAPPDFSNSPDFTTEVRSGDNLSLIFGRAGLSAQDVYQVSRSKPQSPLLSNLYPGYILKFYWDDDKNLESLTISKSKLESIEIFRSDTGYETREIVRAPEIRRVYREATIEDSLFLAAQQGGIPASITMELAGIFGGVIDFLLDTRRGDSFNLLFEEKYLDGEYIGSGAILAAQFTNQGQTHTAVRYVNMAGDTDFYNPEGQSMRKAFLRNPVDFTRISSGFSTSRKHPILNTILAHKGTDYAAPHGTPVIAAGDGQVTWASRNGSFGKLVVIQHGDRFQTKYAHLNDYARGVKKGARVRQGQVIGYVGSTGGATGPHLHYEFLMDGVHRNSRTIHDKLPKAESVPKTELQRFQKHSQILLSQLEVHASNIRNIAKHTPEPQH
jgi:murein DD-endopeptidase MepM/ murein hydrolase activator NlpD